MGISEYEPHVIHRFLELWYRYVVDVITDAQVYLEHASKPTLDPADIKLAIQTKVNLGFLQPPPRKVLLELARNQNKMPLPKSITGPGIPLPPDEETLITQSDEEMEEDEDMVDPNQNSRPRKKRQINNKTLLKEYPFPSPVNVQGEIHGNH
ncbi:hypothetical protein MKX03_035313 [Papaver bracteatum]|nr:hypothetical protein MKX03_035313 [Papaver bracteatum]